jgi:hypothetical protein
MIVISCLLTLFIASSFASSESSLSCESIGDFLHKFSPYARNHVVYKTCFMNESTEITRDDVAISMHRDDSISRLDFFANRKIVCLPVNVSETFPKLTFYNAQNCSLKAISQKNFVGLVELKKLYLDNNEIEVILSDTIEGLVELEWLTLGEYEIDLPSTNQMNQDNHRRSQQNQNF